MSSLFYKHMLCRTLLFLEKMLQLHIVKLAWRSLGHLLIVAAVQLLICRYSSGLFSTLAPPRCLEVNGERRILIICLVNDLSEDMLGIVWFSNGNGSMLESYTYLISKEEDGTFSTLSQISIPSEEFDLWNVVTCYVAQNQTSRIWSTTSLQNSEEHMEDPCPDGNHEVEDSTLSTEILLNRTQDFLLLAIRTLLFKLLLFNVLMTCCILYKK